MSTRRTPFPEESVDWALPDPQMTVLALGRLGGFAELASRAGHRVIAAETSFARANRMDSRVSAGSVYCSPTALPFSSHSVDRVVVGEELTGSGQLAEALPEIARVLHSRGRATLVVNSRDDTVPWVRRLSAIVQQVDPSAMRGGDDEDSAEALGACEHFTAVHSQTWRNWVPISRQRLIDMVDARPAIQNAPEQLRSSLLSRIGELYDSSCRQPDSLMLPFQTTVWSAAADHSRLGLTAPTESLRIKIG